MKKLYFVRTIILAGSLLLQLGTLCLHSRGAAGDVDLSFDPGSGVNGTVNAVLVQPDGKVIIGGNFTTVKGLARSGIARLNADGSGDPTFHPNIDIDHLAVASVALQPDGKILICGQQARFDGSRDGYAMRLDSDGTLDSSFIAATGSYPYGSSFASVVVQSDGRVLLGGEFTDLYVDNDVGLFYFSRYLLVRLNTNGTSDSSFTSVIGAYDLSDHRVGSVALAPDGKVLIGIRGDLDSQVARLNSDGSGDATFNPGTGPNNYLFSVMAQADGKVLIGGYFTAVNGTSRNGIARLNANGSMDSSFNPGAGADYVYSVTLQPDGKLLIFGFFTAVNGTSRKGIARLNSNGTLDSSFDPGTGIHGYYPQVNAFGVQADGKVLMVGNFISINGTNRERIARLNADGSVDATFNPGAGFNTGIGSVVVQPDGKVLVGDSFDTINGSTRKGVARLNADGSLDASFNAGTAPNGSVVSVARQADGKVLIGGDFNMVNGVSREGIARLNANGSLDNSFVPGAIADGGVSIRSVAGQPDGKVLVGGSFYVAEGSRPDGIARLNANGSVDTSFHPDTGVPENDVNVVVLQTDGKVLIGGSYSYIDPQTEEGFALPLPMRLLSDGRRDTSFEPVLGTASPDYQFVQAVAAQPDGKVLFGGNFTTVKGASRNRIARLNDDGTLDLSFDPGTGVAVNSGLDNPYTSGVRSIAVQSDGRLIIGGLFFAFDGTNRRNLARINPNGSLDRNFNPGPGADGKVNSIALQPDGNVLICGDFNIVNGVARPRVARLYGGSVEPLLNIARSNGFVIVSWPVSGLNIQLQENTDLSLPDSWSPVTQPAVTNSGQISVTVPQTVGRKFFRIKSQ